MPRLQQTGVTPNFGTSSGTNPGDDFERENSLQLEAEIPRGIRTPTGGLIQPKPVGRSPIGIEAGQSAGGGLGVVVAVPIGGPISGRGGINIGGDGTIKGGSVGLGIGAGPIGVSIDVGVDQDEEGRGGCYQYVTVSAGPFSHTYGRNVCEPKPPKEPTPTPTPTPTPGPGKGIELPDTNEIGFVIYESTVDYYNWATVGDFRNRTIISCNVSNITYPMKYDFGLPFAATVTIQPPPGYPFVGGEFAKRFRFYESVDSFPLEDGNFLSQSKIICYINSYQACNIAYYGEAKKIKQFIARANEYSDRRLEELRRTRTSGESYILYNKATLFIPLLPPSPSPLSPPVPNPPPKRKEMDDKCCKAIIQLQLETLRLMGREVGPNGVIAQSNKPGFLGEEIERTETPITDPVNPKKIKIQFNTIYEMLVYALKQSTDLDVALDPKSYKPPTGKLQNPAYNRDSKQSLLDNKQPDKDEAGNKRELEINKDDGVKMGGFLQQQAYAFQMLRRLEYLFPAGELMDALIAKDLLIPGAEGDIKIHNMVMAFELQMQYFNATFGNPREILTIKDANPAIAGDQPIEIKALSVSDLLRQSLKFHMDTGGDVDALVNLVLRIFRTDMAAYIAQVKTGEMVQALFEDSGMREQQDYILLHLEGDPYAGQWVKGEGFKPNPDLEKKTEEATEKVLRETMKPQELKVKVSRRHKEEKTDMRDLLRGLADFFQRLLSIPTGGDAASSINKLVESAKFKVQTEMALIRQNVAQAATASRNRTKKRKK